MAKKEQFVVLYSTGLPEASGSGRTVPNVLRKGFSGKRSFAALAAVGFLLFFVSVSMGMDMNAYVIRNNLRVGKVKPEVMEKIAAASNNTSGAYHNGNNEQMTSRMEKADKPETMIAFTHSNGCDE